MGEMSGRRKFENRFIITRPRSLNKGIMTERESEIRGRKSPIPRKVPHMTMRTTR